MHGEIKRHAKGEWIWVDAPIQDNAGRRVPGRIIEVHKEFYVCRTVTGERICQSVHDAERTEPPEAVRPRGRKIDDGGEQMRI